MEIRVSGSQRAERCVYCHDTLESDRIECEACGAAYHVECGEQCVTLGCSGALARRVRPVRAGTTPAFVGALVFATIAAIGIPLGVAAAGTSASRDALGPLACVFAGVAVVTVLGVRAALRPSRIRPRRPAPPRETPLTVPAPEQERSPLELPGFSVQRRVVDGGPSAADVDHVRQQLDAQRAKKKPPGLGKTI